MSEATKTQTAITVSLIQAQPNAAAIVDLPGIAEKYAQTYEALTGKKDGELRYAAEKVLFLQAINANTQLAKADKFSYYTAFMELAISGLTLRDGLCYIVPFKGKAAFMPGWKGRIEQINEMPNVIHTHQPQVVYSGDIFDFELGEKVKIKRHFRGKRLEGETIDYVYWVIDFKHKSEVYIMEREDVLSIRDRYSQTYKTYLADCQKAGKKPGEAFTVKKSGYNGEYDANVEPPMWVTDEAQAFKKTLVKRVYNGLPKLPKQKFLDEKLKDMAEVIDEDEKAFQNLDLDAVLNPEQGDAGFTEAEVVQTAETKKPEPAKQPVTIKKAVEKGSKAPAHAEIKIEPKPAEEVVESPAEELGFSADELDPNESF